MNPRDLPAVWQDAFRSPAMSRARGDALGRHVVPSLQVMRDGPKYILVVKNATYRCEQPVESYIKRSEYGLVVLIQPVDMQCSKGVAKCECFYDIALRLPIGANPTAKDQLAAVLLRGDRYGLKRGESPRIQEIHTGGQQVGAWYDGIRDAASDAWADYKQTLREVW